MTKQGMKAFVEALSRMERKRFVEAVNEAVEKFCPTCFEPWHPIDQCPYNCTGTRRLRPSLDTSK